MEILLEACFYNLDDDSAFLYFAGGEASEHEVGLGAVDLPAKKIEDPQARRQRVQCLLS